LLDSELTFASHVWRLSGKSFYNLRQMNTVQKSVTGDAATTMVQGFVTSRVDYCNSVFHGVSTANVQPLQNMLNAAAWIILHKRMFDHITTEVRHRLHWLPVQQRIEYKVCVLVYKCLHQAAPTYLTELVCCINTNSLTYLLTKCASIRSSQRNSVIKSKLENVVNSPS